MAIEHFLVPNATLSEFLAHMQDCSRAFDRQAVIDIWYAARRSMELIRQREAGCADQAAVLPLPPAMEHQSEAVTRSPELNLAHSVVPVAFGLVEVDSMMTTRRTLSESKLASVGSSVTSYPEDPALASICLALQSPPARVNVTYGDNTNLLIVSDTEDIRLLRCEALTGTALQGVVAPGVSHTALQWVLGTSHPVMHVVRFNGRVLLVKGHHRARVLRAMGVTYLPCLISACESLDDVLEAAPALSRVAVERCFSVPRPAMLRDFDHPTLTYRHDARVRQRLLQVRVEVSSQWLPSTEN